MKKDAFFSITWQWKSGKEWKANNNISLGLLLFGPGDPDVLIKSPRNPSSPRAGDENAPYAMEWCVAAKSLSKNL